MKRVVWKGRGETPLMALKAYQAAHPELAGLPATYAGRLDPMAEGKLILLFGEECKRKEKYLGLDKEYEVEVLLGVGSDTGDALGIVELGDAVVPGDLKPVLRAQEGAFEREYPAYSSKTVDGIPLFEHALRGTIGNIRIPTHTERIYSIAEVSRDMFSRNKLKRYVEEFFALVPKTQEPSKHLGADFRLEAVRESWKKALADEREFPVIKIRVQCASGTYMRSLAERIGAALGTRALALSITRTKIGRRNLFW